MSKQLFLLTQSLRKIQLLRKRYLQQALGKANMHPNQLPIMRYIADHTGCTQAEIAENLALTPAAITLATQRLQKENLIEKKTDLDNLRRNILTLTPVGQKCVRETEEIFSSVDRRMFYGLSSQELDTLQAILDRIAINMTGEASNDLSEIAMRDLLRQIPPLPHEAPKTMKG